MLEQLRAKPGGDRITTTLGNIADVDVDGEFSLVFVSSLFIALGKGNRISPGLATWGPMAVYFLIGLGLLWFRSTNRDLPKFKLPWTS